MTPNTGEDVKWQNSDSLLVGIQNATPTLEDSLGVSHKANIVLAWLSNHGPRYFYEIELKTSTQKNLQMNETALFTITQNCK